MKKLFTLMTACLLVAVAQAQLVNVVQQVVYTDGDNPAALGYPAGHNTVRIVAQLADGVDAVVAVYADADNSLTLGTDASGDKWNTPFGGVTGDALNDAFFGSFPETEWDSMVTIGRTSSADGLTGSITTATALPSATAIADHFGAAGLPGDLVLQDGTWFTTPDQPCALGQGAGFEVVLAQITKPAGTELEYQLNVQLLDGGQGGTEIRYVWDATAADGPTEQVFAGLEYPGPVPLAQTQLDYAAGDYDLCDLIKADWVDADDYRFNFAPQSGGAAISVDQGGPNTFLQLLDVDGLEVGETYDVTVDALFGSDWSIGTVATAISIVAPNVVVNPADNCTNHGPHFLGDYISAKPYVCGGDKWEWSFTPSTGGLPIVYTRNSANRFVRLSTVGGLIPGETYDVTVRAGFPNGAFTAASPAECIEIIGIAPSVEGPSVEASASEAERVIVEPTAAIYPNPNNGDFLNVNLNGVENSKVTIDIVSSFGSFVDRIELNVANGSVNEVVHLNGLASGVYLVNITMDDTVVTERLVVQK